MIKMTNQAIRLNTNTLMPLVGVGTFKIRGREQLYPVLDAALKSGYKAIDTSSVYRNEADIADCLKSLYEKHNISRSDIFITSKLAPKDQGREKCRAACLASLERLGIDYIDLYLIHWPGTQGKKADDPSLPDFRKQSWRALEDLYKEGKCKAIGVSNYTLRHMKELMEFCNVPPAVLQIEHHPHLVQTELVHFCHEHNIHFQAYSSLGSAMADNKLLVDPTVCKVAESVGRSVAQVLLKWAVLQGIGVIPKSTNQDHIRENFDIWNFEISQEDMNKLNSLHKDIHYCWNPDTIT